VQLCDVGSGQDKNNGYFATPGKKGEVVVHPADCAVVRQIVIYVVCLERGFKSLCPPTGKEFTVIVSGVFRRIELAKSDERGGVNKLI
tara:strand:- start:54 stop:317 length:264 start_codon:yes stop_codon:yes gene_type:complete